MAMDSNTQSTRNPLGDNRPQPEVRDRGKRAVDKKAMALERLTVEYVDVKDLRPNSYNPNRQSQRDFELLIKSMTEDGFCVEENTPILCADLIWRKAGELKVGTKIVAFDEGKEGENFKHQRRFRTAEVTSNGLFEDDLFEVKVATGEVVRCNSEHPWLVARNKGAMENRFYGKWCKTSDLLEGDEVYKIVEPWEVDNSYEAGWLAGFLDGEGCLSLEKTHNGSPLSIARLSVTQKPGDTAERMKEAMLSYCPEAEVSVWEHVSQPNWQDNVRVRVNQIGDIMRLLGSVRPSRLLETGQDFWEGRSIVGKNKVKREVVSVKNIGRGTLASLATSTKTYIANGFAVHNTQPIVALKNEKVIVDGEHRWRAAKHLGYDKVPVVFVDMTMEQMRISTLRHNRARGSEDIALSAEVLRDLRELGALEWAQDSLMMDEEEMKILLDDIPVPEGLAADEYSESWVSSKGKESTVSVEAKQVEPRRIEASTPKVVEAMRLAEKKAALVENESEKSQIMHEIKKSIYRIAVSYTGDEAVLVKGILGLQPAVKLVELCKKYESKFAGQEA